MDVSWQWGPRSNPAEYKDGPQAYDNHLYYAYGVRHFPDPPPFTDHDIGRHRTQRRGVHVAHLQYVSLVLFGSTLIHSILDLRRIEDDALLGNTPLWFGGLSSRSKPAFQT